MDDFSMKGTFDCLKYFDDFMEKSQLSSKNLGMTVMTAVLGTVILCYETLQTVHNNILLCTVCNVHNNTIILFGSLLHQFIWYIAS